MKKHILIDNAFRYTEPLETPRPQNCTYDGKRGYWVDNLSGQAMMQSNNATRPQSKKCDRETGEDQKGE